MRKKYRVCLRRNLGAEVATNAEQIDGEEYLFITTGETMETMRPESTVYGMDEKIMYPVSKDYPRDALRWLAEGDLILI